MRTLALLTVGLLALGSGCANQSAAGADFETEIAKLRKEVKAARKEAARAREEVSALDLKAEIHAFMQRDAQLRQGGSFPALEHRIGKNARSYTFVLASAAATPRPMYFKVGTRLTVDFVSGNGDQKQAGNRLEISTRLESFEPLSMKKSEFQAYVIEEGQSFQLRTLAPTAAPEPAPKKKKKRKKKRRGASAAPLATDASPVMFRYLPDAGAASNRQAYVRITFSGDRLQAAPTTGEDAEEAPTFDFSDDGGDS